MPQNVHCYAEGKNGEWEAICLDFDLVVQGNSFEEVYRSLNEGIVAYVGYVSELPEGEQQAFLNRKAPLSIRFRFLWYVLKDAIGGNTNNKLRAGFMAPCTGLPA